MIHVYLAGACGEAADEREAVIDAVLTSGHWPGGPGASGEALAPAIVLPWIRRADAMILVLAASDGGLGPDGSRSLAEWELDEAEALGVPVITVAVSDRQVGARPRQLLGPGLRERFALLRQAAIDNGAPVIDSPAELRAAIVVALARLLQADGVRRWIRDDEATVRSRVADELARLSQENNVLRRREAPIEPIPLAARELAGLEVAGWQALLQGRSVRDLRTRQPLTLERALLDHAAALAVGVATPGDKPAPLEHWLFHDVGGQLLAVGLCELVDGRLRLTAAARAVVAAVDVLSISARGEETVVATSESALRARIASGPQPAARADDDKTNFWAVDAPPPAPRKPSR